MNADGTGRMRVRQDATDDGVGARHAAGDGVRSCNATGLESVNSGRQPRSTHDNQLSAERVRARGEREKESSWFQE
jgi:hypothetical protein